MAQITPIAITVLHHSEGFLFIRRKKAPYENLWALVGGKIGIGEHIPSAAMREITEETSTSLISDYSLHAVVSERLVDDGGSLMGHFLMFLGGARIESFREKNREGDLALFTMEEIEQQSDDFLPSDYEMFKRFPSLENRAIEYHEAELVFSNNRYTLNYYRDECD